MGARQRGGGDGEGGGGYGGVGLCVCACVSTSVCMCQVRVGWQGEERGMQEVYRWAKDRAAKGVSFQILGKRTWVC